MIQIYTGNGKGKTTASLGLALRAVGAGKKVLLIQFLKDGQSSEIKAVKKYLPNFEVKIFGQKGFLNKEKLKKKDFNLAQQGFNFVQKTVQEKVYDLIILDEINLANDFGLIKTKDILDLIKKTPPATELVLTGRKAEKKIIQAADLVSRIKEVKHYFKKGLKARKGIEY